MAVRKSLFDEVTVKIQRIFSGVRAHFQILYTEIVYLRVRVSRPLRLPMLLHAEAKESPKKWVTKQVSDSFGEIV